MMFNRYLGQKQPSTFVLNNQQSMPPDFYAFRRDGFNQRKQGDFQLQPGEIRRLHWRKSRVALGRAGRASHDGVSQHLVRFHDTDAAPQPRMHMQCHEDTTTFRVDSFSGNLCRQPIVQDSLVYRVARQFQQ
jgi:hypothetical protein